MGIFDGMADKVKQHEDKIEAGIEQAGDFVDSKTGGKYADKVDQVQDFANEQLDRFTGGDDNAAPQGQTGADNTADDAPQINMQ